MASLYELNKMIEELVNFDLNKGVTPIELASSIYEDGYTEVRIMKRFGHIECIVSFYDTEFFSDKKLKYEYHYNYDMDNVLQEIIQVQNKKQISLWSRKEERIKLITSIFELAKKANVDLENFLTLDNFQRIQKHLGI